MSTFFGGSRRSMECGGIRASESTYSARLELPRHAHPCAHLCLVLNGDYLETLSGVREARGPMTLIFYPPECPHAELHHAAGRHFLVDWDADWAARIGIASALPTRPAVLNRTSAVFAALRAFRLLHSERTALAVEFEARLALILAELSDRRMPPPRRTPAWFATVMERLRATTTENPTLAGLADEVGVHPSHLARAFKQFAGCSAGEMRRRFQIEQACHSLASTDDALVQVAADAGFADQSHMTRVLREATGFTPRALRSASEAY